jgi:DNA-binding NarL/FixJ family response regulator
MQERSNPGGGILIVDDHAPMIDLLQDLLASAFPGQTMRTAANAEEALVLCRADLPQVVIMDIRLGAVSGIDAARQIKAMSPAVGVVMHTSYDDAIYREECIAAGADAFVHKTKTYAELIPAIARLLSRHPESGSNQ